MTAAPPLTPAQARAVWRQRFPDALACTACGRLLATERARFARLTDAEVAAYVCAECRWEAQVHVRRVRAENLARNRARSHDQGNPEPAPEPATRVDSRAPSNSRRGVVELLKSLTEKDGVFRPARLLRREGAFFTTTLRGGRPTVPLAEQTERRRARVRARRNGTPSGSRAPRPRVAPGDGMTPQQCARLEGELP